jgi:hypothetical protein
LVKRTVQGGLSYKGMLQCIFIIVALIQLYGVLKRLFTEVTGCTCMCANLPLLLFPSQPTRMNFNMQSA